MTNGSAIDSRPGGAGRLEIAVLVSRLLALLDSAARFTEQLPAEALTERVARSQYTALELAYHVPQVVVAFLDAALGGRLTREHFQRKPPQHVTAAPEVAGLSRSVSQALAVWWRANQSRLPEKVDTYYGAQLLHSVLERTTLHVAQHARQLEELLRSRGVAPQPPLANVLLHGLPLPRDAWDDVEMPE